MNRYSGALPRASQYAYFYHLLRILKRFCDGAIIYMPITRYDDPVKLRYNMMLLLSWLYHAKSAIYLPPGYERV